MKPTRVRTLNCSLFIINMNVWCFRKTLTLWWLLHRQCFIARKIFFGGAMSPNHSQAGFLWLIGAPATRINNGGHCASHKTSRVFKYSVIGLCPRLRSLLGVDAALDRAVLENGTRHSTTWWRVYMQLSNDCPSGADDRINFVLCSYLFCTYIIIWWFVRMYCAHGLISSVRWWERAVLSWLSRRNVKITLIFQVKYYCIGGSCGEWM